MKYKFNRKSIFLLVVIICFNFFLVYCASQKNIPPPAKESYEIRLFSRSFTPSPGIEKNLREALRTTERQKVYALIQFHKPVSVNDYKYFIELRIDLLCFLYAHSYVVAIPRGTELDSGNLKELIRWAGVLRPEDKVMPSLAQKKYKKWAIDSTTGNIKILAQFFGGVNQETIKKDLGSLGLEGKPYGGTHLWALIVEREKISQLSRLPSLQVIQQGPISFLPLNDGGRGVVNSNEAQQANFTNPKPAFGKVSGKGVRIGICDSGVDENHDDFDQVTTLGAAGTSRVYNTRSGSGSHGTHVASIAAGNGFNSDNNGLPSFSLRGHAPEAGIGDYPSFGSDVNDFYAAIVNDNTDVTNHSYVQTIEPDYDSEARTIDRIVRGDANNTSGNRIPSRPQVWAAGNNGVTAQYGNEEGYYAVFTSAKNTISVGSVDTKDGRLSDFSSLGPTFDGRIKPDIVAPGCQNSIEGGGIQAADNNTQGYFGQCGTSMAAPVVSGIIALMMEEYKKKYHIGPNLKPATYKAILVQTAIDQVKTKQYADREFNNPDTDSPVLYHAGPDFATGYGLVDANAACKLISKSGHWKESSITSTGDIDQYCIKVNKGTDEVKIALAWDDAPGCIYNAATVKKLVNDLDLELIDPNGIVHLPWTLDPLPLTANPGDGAKDPIGANNVNPAYRGADHRNNVEMVTVCLPMAGIWKVRVKGFSLPRFNIQPYSLASSHKMQKYGIFCFIFPNLCERFPWVCDPVSIDRKFEFKVVDKTWIIDTKVPIPIDEICKYVIDCPGCKGKSWALCPGWEIDFHKLPKETIVTIFNQKGKIIIQNKNRGTSRKIQVKNTVPGDEYFIIFTDREEKPFKEPLEINLDIRSLGNQ